MSVAREPDHPGGDETVLVTERLKLRRLTAADADFMLGLMNEPAYIRFIADRGLRTVEAARAYLADGPLISYARHSFGLWLVAHKDSGQPIGVCGLLRRAGLEDVDLGYALRSEYWGRGYAAEAAAATLDYGRDELGLRRIVAIVSVDNERSTRLLERLGMRYERLIRLPDDDEDLKLFAWEAG
jgi:ribosomal-protein-alanine N-acetyltransferase